MMNNCRTIASTGRVAFLKRNVRVVEYESRRNLLPSYWVKFERWQDRAKAIKEKERIKMMQRAPLGGNMYLTAERAHDVDPKKPAHLRTFEEHGMLGYDTHAYHWQARYLDWSPANLKRFVRAENLIRFQYDQRFLPERHLFLGPDIAAAHFLVHRGGAVKFVGDDRWHKQDENGEYILPSTRIPGVFIEGIDASGTKLMFEGLDNLTDLMKLRYLSLANCDFINDWCLAKLVQYEYSLEFLDLSNCKNISAKGLGSLGCLKELRYLRLSGFDRTKDVAKVALELEKTLPHLEVMGINYDAAIEAAEKEMKLLSHENVVQDARGNLFVKDNLNELYYVDGNVPERYVIDDRDEMPLFVSQIRKDPPVLPYEKLEELNKLSAGKLKHLLAGSPSGEWTQETERVLQMDAERFADENIQVHPFLLPAEENNLAANMARLKEREEQRFIEAKTELRIDVPTR